MATPMSARLLQFRPPRIAMLLLALAGMTHWAAALPIRGTATRVAPAALLGVAGFVLMIAAWWQFRVRRVAICPTAPTARLITDGVYRYTRNPMYLGMLAMLVAVAIAVGSLPFYLAAVVYFLVLNGAFCPFEEAKLAAAFGAEFDTYRRSVRRWIGPRALAPT